MAPATYRYKLTGPVAAVISSKIPAGAITVGTMSPTPYVDINADTTQLTDLSEYMASIGWTYDSTNPATTVAQAQAMATTSQVTVDSAGALIGKRTAINFVGATVVDNSVSDRVDVTISSSPLTSNAPGTVTAGAAAAVGTGTAAARDDHTHGVSTALAAAIANVDAAAASAGAASSIARGDHKHSVTVGNAVAVGSANAQGVSSALSLADHVHDHGSQTVGTMHAAAIAGGANGFLTGTDKTKLDGIPAGSTTQVQINNAGSLDASANFTFNPATNVLALNGSLNKRSIATPAAPGANTSNLFAQTQAGQVFQVWQPPSGSPQPLQAALFSTAVAMIVPQTGTALTLFGMSTTNTGTVSHPTLATTNLQTQMRRVRFASTATAGNSSGFRGTAQQWWLGNAAGLGGFLFSEVFTMSTLLANARAFTGLYASTASISNADPSTLPNIVGMSLDAADANWQIICNDNTGLATKTDLGASFVKSSSDVYELLLFAPPQATSIGYLVTNLTSGVTATGTLSTNIPQNSVFLNPYLWITNNAVNSAAQIELSRLYIGSDT